MFVKLHGFILIFVLLHIVSIFILDFQHHFWPCIHFTWRFAVESYVHVLCKLPKAAKHHLGPIKTHVYPNEIEPVPVFMVAADKDRVPVYVNRTPHFCIHSNVIAVWVRHGPVRLNRTPIKPNIVFNKQQVHVPTRKTWPPPRWILTRQQCTVSQEYVFLLYIIKTIQFERNPIDQT